MGRPDPTVAVPSGASSLVRHDRHTGVHEARVGVRSSGIPAEDYNPILLPNPCPAGFVHMPDESPVQSIGSDCRGEPGNDGAGGWVARGVFGVWRVAAVTA